MALTRSELETAVGQCFAPGAGPAQSIAELADVIAAHQARVRPMLIACAAIVVMALAIAYVAAPALIRTELVATVVTASVAAFTFFKKQLPRLDRAAIEQAARRGDPRPPHGMVTGCLLKLANRESDDFERVVPLLGALIVAATTIAKFYGWT